MSLQSDRNLLIGVLALQMDFVNRDQLIAAMQAWVFDKSQSIDEILFSQRSLDSETRTLLVALVARHLDLHDGDPQKSLAAASSIASLRQQLNSLGDADVQATLHTIQSQPDLDLSPSLGGLDETLTLGQSSSGGQRFQILRPHAQGGLGQVSVARDAELNREVALKEIQREFADDANSRARFLLEAEVTGRLEHPGIVPVYGLGQYDDGRPFYAMRFIRGNSLKEAVDHFHRAEDDSDRIFRLRQLLGRFVDVCQAIQYAHSRGVLHRDLKPGNIMLGKYGETLVVDWGLAKTVGKEEIDAATEEATLTPKSGSGSAPTQMGSAIGTPQFMSPEQAAGRLNELGVKSDVYSLGATLYYILTGKAPFVSEDLGSILKLVERGEFASPRMIRPNTPRPLDAVCMKAMALRQADRYDNPSALADDIERYLADEPLNALREPLTLRGRRWIRKHPRVVASLAATVLVGLVSTAVIAGLVSGKNHELNVANTSLSRSNQKLAELNDALLQANEAKEQERKIAKAVRDFLQKDLLRQADISYQAIALQEPSDDVDDGASSGGGMQLVVRPDPPISELLNRAAISLQPDKIEARFPDQPQIQVELLWTLAMTYMGIGRSQEAAALFERCVKMDRKTYGEDHRVTLRVQNKLALAYRDSGEMEKAISLHEEIIERQALAFGDEHEDRLTSMHYLAFEYIQVDRIEEAIELIEKKIEIERQVHGRDSFDSYPSMAVLALAFKRADRMDDAIALYRQVADKYIAVKGNNHPETLVIQGHLAGAYRKAGQLEEAITLYRSLVDQRSKILGPSHRSTLAALSNLAGASVDAGDSKNVTAVYEQMYEARRAAFGAGHSWTLASLRTLASRYAVDGQHDKAVSLYEELLQRTENELGDDQPETQKLLEELANVYMIAKNYVKAATVSKRLFAGRKSRLGEDHPDTLSAMAKLADAYSFTGKFDVAVEMWRQILAQRTSQLGKNDAKTLQAMGSLATVYLKARRFEEAIPLYEESLAGRERLLGEDHSSTLRVMGNLAKAYGETGQLEKATSLSELRIQRIAASLGEYSTAIATAREELASIYAAHGEIDEAAAVLQKTVDLHIAKSGEPSRITIRTMQMQASFYLKAQRFEDAVRLHENALDGCRQLFGDDHNQTRNTSSQMASIYLKAGQVENAAHLFAEEYDKNPEDALLLLKMASLQVWLGQDRELTSTCRKALEFFADTTDPPTAERVAKACILSPNADPEHVNAAIELAQRSVELGQTHRFLPYFQMTLGMCYFRGGQYVAAEEVLALAIKRGNRHIAATSSYYLAMSMFEMGKHAEGRSLAMETALMMEPPPEDRSNLRGMLGNDDLTLWLAYEEAKTLMKLGKASEAKD